MYPYFLTVSFLPLCPTSPQSLSHILSLSHSRFQDILSLRRSRWRLALFFSFFLGFGFGVAASAGLVQLEGADDFHWFLGYLVLCGASYRGRRYLFFLVVFCHICNSSDWPGMISIDLWNLFTLTHCIRGSRPSAADCLGPVGWL